MVLLVVSAALYSNAEKDQLETEVGLCVKVSFLPTKHHYFPNMPSPCRSKACSQQIDRLKDSVLASQGNSVPAGGLNGQAAAHLHGVVSCVVTEHLLTRSGLIHAACLCQVLVLAESLQRTAASFDECRSHRYKQKVREEQQRRHLTYKVRCGLQCIICTTCR